MADFAAAVASLLSWQTLDGTLFDNENNSHYK
jgi:hypothetical protein